MRHDDIRRLNGIDDLWLRFRIWLVPKFGSNAPIINDFSSLSDPQRRDIGLSEPPRYADWKSLGSHDRYDDFTR